MAVIKRPQSAYFQFSGEKRKQIAQDNAGLRVGDVQKLITAQWKELTIEEKQVYLDMAAKDKERYEREKLENPVDTSESAQQDKSDTEADGSTCLYPLGRVKRIIQSDPDVNKISREALIAISKASELFAQYLATKSYEQTLFNNKRQIKASDVTRAIHITSVLDWLREDFPDKQAVPAKRSHDNEATAREAKAKASASDVSAFFRQHQPGQAEEEEARDADEDDNSDSAATDDVDGSAMDES